MFFPVVADPSSASYAKRQRIWQWLPWPKILTTLFTNNPTHLPIVVDNIIKQT
jgi:hypothetical protein